MAYFITCREPGQQRSKLYAGRGNLTTKIIHAKQYAQTAEVLQVWVDELNRDNPGCVFGLRKVPARQDITVQPI